VCGTCVVCGASKAHWSLSFPGPPMYSDPGYSLSLMLILPGGSDYTYWGGRKDELTTLVLTFYLYFMSLSVPPSLCLSLSPISFSATHLPLCVYVCVMCVCVMCVSLPLCGCVCVYVCV
jgi:hypothetical protein